jgi:di/tricarboxylate transporter
MGSPLAGLMTAPVGMPVAKKYGMDPMLMALAIGSGISAGAFAPTSLFGIVSYGAAQQAEIDLNPLTLFAVAVIANLGLLIAAFVIFGRPKLVERRGATRSAGGDDALCAPFERNQIATIVCMIGLVVAVIATSISGLNPDIGVLCFAFGAVLALIDPRSGMSAVSKIDWSTVLLVGGIITFVGVLQHMGSVDMLGEAAKNIGAPIVTALVICLIGALVSAFASTTGILAALVPLAVPLAASGDVAGWALISALAVCSSIVDVSPFSTVGATLVATAAEEDRPRMTSLLTRWGMSMVVAGPIVLVAILVLPGTLWLIAFWKL